LQILDSRVQIQGSRCRRIITLKYFICCLVVGILCPTMAFAQRSQNLTVALVKMPYSGSRNVTEISQVPDYLEEGGIAALLREMGVQLTPIAEVRLTARQDEEYGSWHRMGLANGNLAGLVAQNTERGYLSVGLLANCTSLLGVLGGLQRADPGGEPQRVALIFIDAHADFNIPETTLSGMLGGMPVAVAAGMALHNLRRESGLEQPLPTAHIVMGALRDVDPLEQELLDDSDIETFSVEDIRSRSDAIHAQMRRLSQLVDLIYVHVDMDVLDPSEVGGHPLTVPDGPTSQELAAVIVEMFKYQKVAALGVASTPAGERDPDGLSRQAAYNLIRAAVLGVQQRGR
jgi:arginase